MKDIFRVVLVLFAIYGYYAPWLLHSDAALNPNARDLAEWATLNPVLRTSSPPLISSFALRVSLAFLVMLAALYGATAASRTMRWICRAAVVILTLTLFPPVDFLVSAQNDPNYLQQFGVACAALLISGLLSFLNRFSEQNQALLAVSLVLSSGIAAGVGLWYGVMYRVFPGITQAPDSGFLVYELALVLLLLSHLVDLSVRGQTMKHN